MFWINKILLEGFFLGLAAGICIAAIVAKSINLPLSQNFIFSILALFFLGLTFLISFLEKAKRQFKRCFSYIKNFINK